jgi:hypothetical protein
MNQPRGRGGGGLSGVEALGFAFVEAVEAVRSERSSARAGYRRWCLQEDAVWQLM